ncbi:MAG: nuclear transport factor 2 family protein [Deltaproteobacteria bacterium]|jgi:hypothetical protein
MPAFPRQELEEMMERWLEANRRAEASGDWTSMTELYTEDAEYHWNSGPTTDFVARGHKEISQWALGLEMEGLEGWTYPYETVLIDENKGEIVAFWKQISDARREDGSFYEAAGVGGSHFRYAGNFKWSWQRDFFDTGNARALFAEMGKAGKLSPAMLKRISGASGLPPGHYKR